MEKIKEVNFDKLKGSNVNIEKLKESVNVKKTILRDKKVVRK